MKRETYLGLPAVLIMQQLPKIFRSQNPNWECVSIVEPAGITALTGAALAVVRCGEERKVPGDAVRRNVDVDHARGAGEEIDAIADVVGVNPPYVQTFQGGLLGTVGGAAIAPGVPGSAVDATLAANEKFSSGFAQGQLSCVSAQ